MLEILAQYGTYPDILGIEKMILEGNIDKLNFMHHAGAIPKTIKKQNVPNSFLKPYHERIDSSERWLTDHGYLLY